MKNKHVSKDETRRQPQAAYMIIKFKLNQLKSQLKRFCCILFLALIDFLIFLV